MDKRFVLLMCGILLVPGAAFAYVGPGATLRTIAVGTAQFMGAAGWNETS